RRTAAGLAAVAVLGVLAVTVGPAAAALYRSQPYDPRALFVPPQQTSEALNPLGLLSAWATETELPLLEVTSDRPVRTNWVAMSRFDGITWLPDDQFRAAGSVLPTVEPKPLKSTTVKQQITVRSLGGAWLPAAEVPRSVGGLRASFDAGSRMLAAPDGLREGLTYTVTSEVPVRDPNYLLGAGLPAGKEYDHLLQVPQPLPEGFAELAEKAAGDGTPYQKALRLEKYLRTTYQFQPGAPSGHGYANLAYFLTEEKAKGGGRGTSEQFATAYAILGRVIGLPTRVVVGFHAGKEAGTAAGTAGTTRNYLVSSGDAFAWAEVYLLGEGWVPFDPTPGREGAQPPPEENTPEAEAESEQEEAQLTKPNPSPPPGADDPAAGAQRGSQPSGVPTWVVLLAVTAAALLAVLLVLPALRYRRSHSRFTRGGPAQRVLGAWAEVRDALRLAGHRPAASATAGELALAHSGPGLPELHPLAARVNAITFAPAAPLPEPDAAAAVADARHYTRTLRRHQPLLRRALWWLDPRPLLWR
ncbi:MAG: DUF3488 and transglutaminase-like domain-containing protein, partial [Micromonosporaceae bacterium]